MRQGGSSPHVLVVHLDHFVRVRYRTLLEGAGCLVSTATDGGMAIDLLEHSERTVGLILVNLSETLIRDSRFVERLSAHPQWSAIPIVLMGAEPVPAPGNVAAVLTGDATDEVIVQTVLLLAR